MADLVVSAPGKVILFGDHSVVYDRLAIAAAISLRTTLSFTKSTDSGLLTLDFPDVGLHLALTASEIHDLSHLAPSDAFVDGLPPAEMNERLSQAIDLMLIDKSLSGVPKAAASAFLYLFLHIARDEASVAGTMGRYRIDSQVPIGAGLGSSAAVSVIIATSLLLLTRTIDEPEPETAADDDLLSATRSVDEVRKVINAWAFVGERCIHGTPSGVDNTVATYGNAVGFRKSLGIATIPVPQVPLLITDTKVPRSTRDQVAKVAALRLRMPLVTEPILDAMHQVAIEGRSVLASTEVDLERLGELMVLNHGLLRTLGVSHARIEEVVDRHAEIGWTKLIGAGGGGCVITLLRDLNYSEEKEEEGTAKHGAAETYQVALGGPGVGVHGANGTVRYF